MHLPDSARGVNLWKWERGERTLGTDQKGIHKKMLKYTNDSRQRQVGWNITVVDINLHRHWKCKDNKIRSGSSNYEKQMKALSLEGQFNKNREYWQTQIQ